MSGEVISLIVPTRGRPNYIKQLWESAYSLASRKDLLEIVFRIDNDDTASLEAISNLYSEYGDKIVLFSGKRITLSECNNQAYSLAKGDIIWLGGDDNLFKTKSWDDVIRREFDEYDDRICLVGGNDLCNQEIITHPFLSREFINELGGKIAPFQFKYNYTDTVLNDIANGIGRVIKTNVVIEHLHFSNGKREVDETTKSSIEGINDAAYQYEIAKPEISNIIRRIKNKISLYS